MKNKLKKFCYVSILILFIMLNISSNILAAEDMNKIYSVTGGAEFTEAAGQILGVVQAVGYVTCVIMLTYIGIKFILAAPEGKAKIKQQLIIYCIGALILFSGATIAGVIANAANTIIK